MGFFHEGLLQRVWALLVRPGRFPDVGAEDCRAREDAKVQMFRRTGRAQWEAVEEQAEARKSRFEGFSAALRATIRAGGDVHRLRGALRPFAFLLDIGLANDQGDLAVPIIADSRVLPAPPRPQNLDSRFFCLLN